MKVNGERLLIDLRHLRQFTDTPGNGVTRFSYGKSDQKARDYLISQAREIGCQIEIDALKNIRFLMPQNRENHRKVVIGSHIDTVKNGGWLDGVYGVAGGMEVLRVLKDAAMEKNLELVIFAEEEGSNFGSTMTGSKFISGIYQDEDLDRLKTDEGITLRDVLGKPADDQIRAVLWDFAQVEAMLELHIEQGPVLEREGLTLGIVDTIFGMETVEVTITGVGNHAGATPMGERKDALCAAAECILAAETIVEKDGSAVATAGQIRTEPGCSNVIPEKTIFTLEVRDSKQKNIDFYMAQIKEAIKKICATRAVQCSIKSVAQSKPLCLSDKVRNEMKELAERKGIAYKIMDSGAVHDACMIAEHADTGMIFVPSIGGRSHVPQENTHHEDLIEGAQFLLEITEQLAGA